MKKRKELSITFPPLIKSYLPISIMSSIAHANLNSNVWIMNNFIQLFKYECLEKIESFPINNFLYFDQDLFRVSEMNGWTYNFNRETFIEDLLRWVDKENYVVVYVNEYLLPGMRHYQKKHMLHPQFITGYNMEKESFQVWNFAQGTDDLEITDVSFGDIEQAFFDESTAKLYTDENVSWAFEGKMYMVHLIRFLSKKGEYYDYGLNYQHMLLEMENYLYAKDSSNYTNYFTGHVIGSWGMDVYKEMYRIYEQSVGKKVDYRMTHLLYEHKFYMKERIALFEKENSVYSEQYDEIVKQANILRLTCLKYNFSLSKDDLCEMLSLINSISEAEKEVLEGFLLQYKKDYFE